MCSDIAATNTRRENEYNPEKLTSKIDLGQFKKFMAQHLDKESLRFIHPLKEFLQKQIEGEGGKNGDATQEMLRKLREDYVEDKTTISERIQSLQRTLNDIDPDKLTLQDATTISDVSRKIKELEGNLEEEGAKEKIAGLKTKRSNIIHTWEEANIGNHGEVIGETIRNYIKDNTTMSEEDFEKILLALKLAPEKIKLISSFTSENGIQKLLKVVNKDQTTRFLGAYTNLLHEGFDISYSKGNLTKIYDFFNRNSTT